MLWLLGTVTVILCIAVGYGAHGGSFHVLWQPFEFLIIVGSAAGALLTACTRPILGEMLPALKTLFHGPKYTKNPMLTF